MITRDIWVQRREWCAPIDYVQATNTIPLQFVLMDWTLEGGEGARVYVRHSDGTAAYQTADLSTVDDHPVISFTPAISTFPVIGLDSLQCEIFNDTETLVSFSVPVHVHKNNANGTKSGDNFNIFNKELNDIKHLADTIAAQVRGVALCDYPRVSADAVVGKEMLDLCEDWYQHRDKLYYKLDDNGNPNNLFTLWDYRDVNKGRDNNKYQIDCSSLVLSVLSGVSYASSRYALSGGEAEPETRPHNVAVYPWGRAFYTDSNAPYEANSGFTRYAADIAKFAYENGFAFKPSDDGKNLAVGDLVFFTPSTLDPSDTHWEHITHVGIYAGKQHTGWYCIFNAVSKDQGNVKAPIDYSYFKPTNPRIWGAARFPMTPSGKQLTNIAINTGDLTKKQAAHEIITLQPLKVGKWYTAALKATRHADTQVRLNIGGSPNVIASYFGVNGSPDRPDFSQPIVPTDVPGVYYASFRVPETYETGPKEAPVTHQTGDNARVIYLRNGAGDEASADSWDYEWLALYEGICDIPAEHIKTGPDSITPVVINTSTGIITAEEAPQGYSISNTCPDAPATGYYYVYKTHLNAARTLGSQEAIRLSDATHYTRTLTAAGWSDWVRPYDSALDDITNKDCNVLDSGEAIGHHLVNGPHATAWTYVHTVRYNDNVCLQDATIVSTGVRYTRSQALNEDTHEAEWSAWTMTPSTATIDNTYVALNAPEKQTIDGQDYWTLPYTHLYPDTTQGAVTLPTKAVTDALSDSIDAIDDDIAAINGDIDAIEGAYIRYETTAAADLDTLAADNLFIRVAGTETHAPANAGAGWLMQLSNGTDKQQQYFADGGARWERACTSGTWSAWVTATATIATTNISGLNCNTLSTGDGIGNNLINGPHATNWCHIHTSVLGTNIASQDATIISTGVKYSRQKVGGTWGAWKLITLPDAANTGF